MTQLLTTDQAAEICNITRGAIIKAILRKQLKAVKIGSERRGQWLIEQAEAERYRDERRKPGRPRKVNPDEQISA